MTELQAQQELDETLEIESGQYDEREILCDCGYPMELTDEQPHSYYEMGWQEWRCTNKECMRNKVPEVRA